MKRSLLVGFLAVTTVCAMASGASGAAANLCQNGSFEKPVVSPGGYLVFSTGQSFGGWQVVGASGNVAPVSATFTQNGLSFPARSGKQWLDLTGNSNTATGVSRTVATTVGTSYTLSFAVGNVYDPGSIFGTTSTVDVLVNGAQVLAATNTLGPGSAAQVWKHFSKTFTATGSATTISFINGDPTSDTSNGLDAVKLVALT
jgi:Protein of unknown function (DUF642)